MGVLIDLLRQDNFRKRTVMYTGYWEFARIASWFRGFQFAQSLLGQPDELEGFKEWLQVKFDGQANTDWAGIVEGSFRGDDEAILQKFFEELDQFLRYRDEVGINQIIDEHESFEIRRFGRINSGRLKRR